MQQKCNTIAPFNCDATLNLDMGQTVCINTSVIFMAHNCCLGDANTLAQF